MGLVIDTCVFIRAEKTEKHIDFNQWREYGNVYISAITVSELLVGVHRANNEVRRVKRSAFVETILSRITALNFTAEIARTHAELCAFLLNRGEIIGANDLIIAATAITNDYALLTTNEKDFAIIPGIKLLKIPL